MSIFETKTGPLADQIQLTLQKLRVVSDDGTFCLDDFPELSETYLTYIRGLLRQKYGDEGGASETARATILRAMQHNEMYSENRVFDRGCSAMYALYSAALEWPCGDVQRLIKYLGFHNGFVRNRAAQELQEMGEAARAAIPALQRCAAGDPQNVATTAARTALQKLTTRQRG